MRGKAFERESPTAHRRVPGVRSVALARYTPLGYNNDIEYVTPEIASTKVPENGFGAFNNIVTPEYFATAGIPIIEGRGFDLHDDAQSPKVVVVTQHLARTLWPGQSAIGKRMRMGKDGPQMEVVGVSGNIQYFSVGEPPRSFFFRPYAQHYRSSFTVNVHTAGDPAALIKPVRDAIASLDPELPVFDVEHGRPHHERTRCSACSRRVVRGGVRGAALVLASGLQLICVNAPAGRHPHGPRRAHRSGRRTAARPGPPHRARWRGR